MLCHSYCYCYWSCLINEWINYYKGSHFIGLMWSKKTSVMTTPKCLGTQIWQIYPRSASRCTPHQSSIDALNTATPNLADLPQICQQMYPLAIEHRCLEYHYTKLGRSHIWQICLADLPPCQSSIDALNTIRPNLADLLANLIFGRSAWQIYPPTNQA